MNYPRKNWRSEDPVSDPSVWMLRYLRKVENLVLALQDYERFHAERYWNKRLKLADASKRKKRKNK